MKVMWVILSLLATALAFDCKQCMKMRTDNEDVNKILDLSMSGSMSGGPISYTADCMHDAPSITPSTCTADMGCMAMKINVCYTAVGKKVNMEIYLRTCRENVEIDTGCYDVTKYKDDIHQMLGESNLGNMNGIVCVCEDENCNVQQFNNSELIPDGNEDVYLNMSTDRGIYGNSTFTNRTNEEDDTNASSDGDIYKSSTNPINNDEEGSSNASSDGAIYKSSTIPINTDDAVTLETSTRGDIYKNSTHRIETASGFECKKCMYIATAQKSLNDILDSTMSGSAEYDPYTADCMNDASDITSTTCPDNIGCTSAKINTWFATGGEKVKIDVFARSCRGRDEMDVGCTDVTKYTDKIRASMGAGYANFKNMTGTVCVCEEENCNDQPSSKLIPDERILDGAYVDTDVLDGRSFRKYNIKDNSKGTSKGTMVAPTFAFLIAVLMAFLL